MKVKISYKPEEENDAAATVAALLQVLPGAKVRKIDRHEPFIHTYLTTRTPKSRCGPKQDS